MHNIGDKVRVVDANGLRWLEVGMELEVVEERGPAYVCVNRPELGACTIRADRVELVVPPVVAVPPVAPPRAAPVRIKVPGVFEEGDRVVVARGRQHPRHAHGMNEFMEDAVGRGDVYTIKDIVLAHAVQPPFVHFEEVGNAWDVRMLDHAEPAAPAIIQPVIKQGQVMPVDLVAGMKVLFTGEGTNPATGGCQVGVIYDVIARHESPMGVYIRRDGGRHGAYLNNFHHVPVHMLEIVVGSLVEVVNPYKDMRRGRQLIVQGVSFNASGNKVLSFDDGSGRQWRIGRFQLIAPPGHAPAVPEAPYEDIPEEELTVAVPFKAGDKVKIFQRVEKMNQWRHGDQKKVFDEKRHRVIESVSARGTVTLVGCGADKFDLGCFIKPVPVPKDADLRKLFTLKEQGYWHGSLCSFAYISNGETCFELNGPCHGSLTSSRITELVIGTAAMVGQSSDVERLKRYHHYLANESPWAKCFTTKDVEEAYREGGFIMNTDEPKGHVVGAAVAARAGHEHQGRMPAFIHFIEKGYSGNVAFMLSLKLNYNEKSATFAEINTSGGHDCITSYLDYNSVVDFFHKGFPDQKDIPCKVEGDGYTIHNKIDLRNGYIDVEEQFGTLFARGLKTEQIGEGWDKTTVVQAASVYAMADKFTQIFKEQ